MPFTGMRATGTRAFWAVSAGQLVSSVGSGMTRFGLALWVLGETGDTAEYTALLFFAFLPLGLGSLVAGPVVDRFDRRSVMLVANAVASLSTLAVATLYFTDRLEIWHLYVALFVNGAANSFVLPSFESSLPLLVPKERIGNAAGFVQIINALETIAAPGLAGFVVALADIGVLFIVDFVTFGASLAVLLASRIPRPPASEAREALHRAFASGLRYIRERSALLRLFTFVTLLMLLNAGFGFALCTPLVMSFADERAAGLVLSCFGVGALGGGMLLATTGGPARRMDGILYGLVLAAASSFVISARENVWLVGFGVVLIGASFMYIMGLVRVIFAERVAPDYLGRVSSLRMAFGTSAQVIGIAAAGPVADRVFAPLMVDGGALAGSVGQLIGTGPGRGIALLYAILGSLMVFVTLGSLALRRLRYLEDELPLQGGSA